MICTGLESQDLICTTQHRWEVISLCFLVGLCSLSALVTLVQGFPDQPVFNLGTFAVYRTGALEPTPLACSPSLHLRCLRSTARSNTF